MTPEQKARQQIDQQLIQAGWEVQDVDRYNPSANVRIAVREYPMEEGTADYLLVVHEEPVWIIKAKSESRGEKLSKAKDQAQAMSQSILKKVIEGILVEHEEPMERKRCKNC